jgi:hypothetical protein
VIAFVAVSLDKGRAICIPEMISIAQALSAFTQVISTNPSVEYTMLLANVVLSV